MSKIGKQPVIIPAGVTVEVSGKIVSEDGGAGSKRREGNNKSQHQRQQSIAKETQK